MKKNYIAHLQQYQAKTSASAKQNHYRKKFTKTLYNNDKENINPNMRSTSKSKKNLKTKSSPKGIKSHHISRLNTEKDELCQAIDKPRNTFGAGKTINQQNKQHYQELKMKCVKITRRLKDQQAEEEEKCLTYYSWLTMQIEHQQKQATELIESIYKTAIKQIDNLSVLLDEQYREGSFPWVPEVDLELIRVELAESMRPKIHDHLQQLNILNLNKCELQQSPSPSSCKLQCSEELTAGPPEPSLVNKLRQWTSSFANGGCPVVYEATESEEGISPSFKEF